MKGAGLENGLLHVELVRELPEAMKPRAIPIATIETKSPRSSTARRHSFVVHGLNLGAPHQRGALRIVQLPLSLSFVPACPFPTVGWA